MAHETNPTHDAAVTPSAGPATRRWPVLAGLTLLAVAGLAAGYVLLREVPQDGFARTLADPGDDKLPVLMRSWDRPEVALVISGQMHGYIDPCGCSAPQYGGLPRRYNFVELLKHKGWPVVGIDLGELPTNSGLRTQSLLKYRLSMQALDRMNYRAIGIGKSELKSPLADALVQIDDAGLKNIRPLAGSLEEAQKKGGLYHDLGVRPYEILGDTTPRLGVVSLIGPDLAAQFPQEKFLANSKVLTQALDAFAAASVEMAVLLYHEYPIDPKTRKLIGNPRTLDEERHATAAKLAAFCERKRRLNPRLPAVPIILSLTEESEPPSQMMPLQGTSTQLIEIGHKGRHVGVVGVYAGKNAGSPELKYQLVSIGPEFDTPTGKEKDHPILALFENYAGQVKRQDLLARYDRVPHAMQVARPEAKYVGTETCAGCHQHAYDVWKNTGHAHAFDALVKAEHPSNRQFDGECVVCHTVGFRHPTGYYHLPDPNGLRKKDAPKYARKFTEHNAKLENVGCESCHGPGSAHANNPDDPRLYELLNPFRATDAERKAEQIVRSAVDPESRQSAATKQRHLNEFRMRRLDDFCQKCHDVDNDVNWAKVPFQDRWEGKIAHPTPRRKQAARSK